MQMGLACAHNLMSKVDWLMACFASDQRADFFLKYINAKYAYSPRIYCSSSYLISSIFIRNRCCLKWTRGP